MDGTRFDRWTRNWSTTVSRRGIGGIVAATVAALAAPETEGRRRRRKKKKEGLTPPPPSPPPPPGDPCAARCPNGCCHPETGACRDGTTREACGREGESCAVCLPGQACRDQHCCGGNSLPCGEDEDCCEHWVCRTGQCCARNGDPPSTASPRCCEAGDERQGGICCRPTGGACDDAIRCCGEETCVEQRCCRQAGTACEIERDDQCCPGFRCDIVFTSDGTFNGVRCCVPEGVNGCTTDNDCCNRRACDNGTCQQCPRNTHLCGRNPGENHSICCDTEGQCCAFEGGLFCCNPGTVCNGNGGCE